MEIYVVGWDGEVAQRLTNREGLDIRPAWSPDGKRIAFTSVRAGNYEVAVIHADGTRMINEISASGRAGLNRASWPMTWRQPRSPEEIARWERRQAFADRDPQFFDYYDRVDFLRRSG